MNDILHYIIIPFVVAFLATMWIHPKILKIAITKNLVDNPDARKLQRVPIPTVGGIAVFFGIILGVSFSNYIYSDPKTFILMSSMMVMLYLGTIDDIIGLSPRLRFLVEICVIVVLITVNDTSINNFHGLWGIYQIPEWIAIPLTVFACVGIINAINLIDGVNGLSSGYSIMASSIIAIMAYASGNILILVLAITAVGATIPFFLHNVFGKKTKMFIGDGGALVIGIMMSLFVVDILGTGSNCTSLANGGMGLVPFTLALLSIPVFDTLRVMSTRIKNGVSPFEPDKTHLHHIFIELGFTHLGTTISILTFNTIIVGIWFLSYSIGASVEMQLYIVLILSILLTFGFYKFAERQIRKKAKGYRFLQSIGKMLSIEKKGIWETLQKLIDKL